MSAISPADVTDTPASHPAAAPASPDCREWKRESPPATPSPLFNSQWPHRALPITMAACDHLVGITNYDDSPRPELKNFPKIGDYQTIDWERLRALKPQILIIFQSPDRISPGLKERAAKLNIKLVNIRTETL